MYYLLHEFIWIVIANFTLVGIELWRIVNKRHIRLLVLRFLLAHFIFYLFCLSIKCFNTCSLHALNQ
jgi:hypothetical protein